METSEKPQRKPEASHASAGRRGRTVRANKKFLQTLKTETYHAVEKEATQRGSTVQELLRAVIIPEWLYENRRLVMARGSGGK